VDDIRAKKEGMCRSESCIGGSGLDLTEFKPENSLNAVLTGGGHFLRTGPVTYKKEGRVLPECVTTRHSRETQKKYSFDGKKGQNLAKRTRLIKNKVGGTTGHRLMGSCKKPKTMEDKRIMREREGERPAT